MNRWFRALSAQTFCLVAVYGLLAASVPGCSDTAKQEQVPTGVPPSLEESNKNMENFMKTQGAAKNQ